EARERVRVRPSGRWSNRHGRERLQHERVGGPQVVLAVGGRRLRGGDAVREEGCQLALVAAQPEEDRVELAQRRVEVPQQRAQLVGEALERRKALHRRAEQWVEVREQRLEVGGERGGLLQGRVELPRGGLELRDQRVRVLREGGQALQRRAGLALEGRQHDERLGELVVAQRRGLEDAVGVLDQRAQLAIAGAERVEHDARVVDELREVRLLRVQDLEEVRRVLREGH